MRRKRVVTLVAVAAVCVVAWDPVPMVTTYEVPKSVLVKRQWGRQGHWQECIRRMDGRPRNCHR